MARGAAVSVWGTIWVADSGDHASECGRWKPLGKTAPHTWSFELDETRPCTCGQPGSPIRYWGSHVLPSEEDERGGSVQLAEVPGHITRDGRDDGPDDGVTPWPYLRLSVGQEDVVLDEALARSLWEALGGWLEQREQR
jgi:hypothetical protein